MPVVPCALAAVEAVEDALESPAHPAPAVGDGQQDGSSVRADADVHAAALAV